MNEQLTDSANSMIDFMDSVDPTKTPKYRFMLLLRDQLCHQGFDLKEAAQIISRMKVTIPQELIDDEGLTNRLVESMASLMRRTGSRLEEDFGEHGFQMLIEMAGDFTFEATLS